MLHCTPSRNFDIPAACRRLLACLLPAVLAAIALPAAAIVIRHDRADAAYVVDAGHYPQFFHLQLRNQRKVCLATLISAQWAITAGHCTEDTPLRAEIEAGQTWPVDIAGVRHEVVELVLHPEYRNGKELAGVDLALLRLREPVAGVAPLRLQREADELHRVVSLLGWGYTGTGAGTRRFNDGKLRRAYNTVAEAGQWLIFHFDDPRQPGNAALDLEGIPGLGDSGGPAFLELGDGPVLLGIAVGEMADEAEGGARGSYGAVEVYERISLHLEWIDTVLGGWQPTP